MRRVYHSPHEVHTDEAAALLGVTTRTIQRWMHEGRLSYPLTMASVATRPQKRQRGPQRKRYSVRYVSGRHGFTTRNWMKGGDAK